MKREHYNIILNKIIFTHVYYKDGFKKIKFGDKEFNDSLERISLEKHTYNCIIAINNDSILKINSTKLETNDIKKIYPQAYLEQCKYKLKKEKVVNFIDSKIIDDDSDDGINDAVDSHLNFLVPDSYVEI